MSYQIIIKEFHRVTHDEKTETLPISTGVNIISGNPNSGKTVWLNLIDYLLGDTDSIENAVGNEDKFGIRLCDKYVAVKAVIEINKEQFELERRWHEAGSKGKFFVNGEAKPIDSFSEFIFEKLGIPNLHFPKGNPFAERAWPQLSWRMLFRHMYRQERFWSDLADKQPESEQHAALAQFLGIASKLFSQQLGVVVNKRKELLRLEAEKNQYERVLDDIAKSMTSGGTATTFATKESILKSISDLELQIHNLLEERKAKVEDARRKLEADNDGKKNIAALDVSDERNGLILELTDLLREKAQLDERIQKFNGIHTTLISEINKLKRAKDSGYVLADIKISHCPSCDQEIRLNPNLSKDECFVCHQTVPSLSNERQSDRINFEIAQLESERKELRQLVDNLVARKTLVTRSVEEKQSRANKLERLMAPLQQSISTLVNEDLTIIDSERGRIEEQIENFKRILKNLDYKYELIDRIDGLNKEIGELETTVDENENDIDYEQVSNDLADGIANYLGQLNTKENLRWPLPRVKFKMGQRNFSFKVSEARWTSIGATLKVYFLFAYHYALLTLSSKPSFNYPGFLMVDFPPELVDEIDLNDKENYLIQPFIDLCKNSEATMQVIFAGKAFENLTDVTYIRLNEVWK